MEDSIRKVEELVLKGAEAILLIGDWSEEVLEGLVESLQDKVGTDVVFITLPNGESEDSIKTLDKAAMAKYGWFRKDGETTE